MALDDGELNKVQLICAVDDETEGIRLSQSMMEYHMPALRYIKDVQQRQLLVGLRFSMIGTTATFHM